MHYQNFPAWSSGMFALQCSVFSLISYLFMYVICLWLKCACIHKCARGRGQHGKSTLIYCSSRYVLKQSLYWTWRLDLVNLTGQGGPKIFLFLSSSCVLPCSASTEKLEIWILILCWYNENWASFLESHWQSNTVSHSLTALIQMSAPQKEPLMKVQSQNTISNPSMGLWQAVALIQWMNKSSLPHNLIILMKTYQIKFNKTHLSSKVYF